MISLSNFFFLKNFNNAILTSHVSFDEENFDEFAKFH